MDGVIFQREWMLNSIHILSIYIPEKEKYFNLMFMASKTQRKEWLDL